MKLVKLIAAAAVCISASATTAVAQTWPTHNITLVVPYPPGATDAVARLIIAGVEPVWGQKIILENTPGGASVTGTVRVVNQPADGYTWLIAANLLAHLFQKSVPFEQSDVQGVVGIASNYYVAATNPSVGKTLKEVIDQAKANPKKVNAGMVTNTPLDLDTNAFAMKAGVEMTTVGYNGGTAIVEALARGDLQFGLIPQLFAIELSKAGKLNLLAYAGPQRSSTLPNLPTLKEAGVDMTAGFTLGFYVKAKTPAAVVSKINADVAAVSSSPAVIAKLREMGYDPAPNPRQFGQQMESEFKSYSAVAQRMGLKPQ